MFVTKNMPEITSPVEGIVELMPTERGLDVVLNPTGTPITDISLTWQFDVKPYTRSLGDTWGVAVNNIRWAAREDLEFSPWYFTLTNGERTVCFGVKTLPNAFAAWYIDEGDFRLVLDTRSGGEGVLLKEPLCLATVISMESENGESTFAAMKRFCRMMCEKPVLPSSPVYGFNTWYYSYGKITRSNMMRDAELCATLASGRVPGAPLPYMVIDDGYQMPRTPAFNGGPFLPNDDFGDLRAVADDIRERGCNPGIWVRTMLVRPDLCPEIPEEAFSPMDEYSRGSGGRVLDITTAPAKEYVFNLVRSMRDMGYGLIKHDFTCMDMMGNNFLTPKLTSDGWHLSDRTKTNAQILKELYTLIEEAAEGSAVIGCNTYGHLSAGIHPIHRIGQDTSGYAWYKTRRYGVNTLAYRLCQNDTFFKADADCACFTKHVPTDKNILFADLIARTNSALFISAAPDILKAKDIDRLIEIYRISSKGQTEAEPLDWLTNPFPALFRWNDLDIQYPWF